MEYWNFGSARLTGFSQQPNRWLLILSWIIIRTKPETEFVRNDIILRLNQRINIRARRNEICKRLNCVLWSWPTPFFPFFILPLFQVCKFWELWFTAWETSINHALLISTTGSKITPNTTLSTIKNSKASRRINKRVTS